MNTFSTDSRSSWIGCWNHLGRKLRRHLAGRYSDAGLSDSRAGILEALDAQTRRFTQSELAGLLVISESSLCVLIEKMRQEGLVERERCPLDRRRTVLSLTPFGHRQCHAVRNIHRQFEQEVSQLLTVQGSHLDLAGLQQVLMALERLDACSDEERRVA